MAKVNGKQLHTANQIYILDDIILIDNVSKYRIMTIIELPSFPL